MERVLVTGSSGFVGQHLLRALTSRLDASARVFAGHHKPVVLPATRCQPCQLDITDRQQVGAAICETQPTCVVHLAAISAPQEARRDPRRAFDVNLVGTLNLATAVLQHAPEARFIFIGTSEVYGGTFQRCTTPLDETALLDPSNPYAASKAAADLAIGQMVRDGLRALRFRPFNHTGPGQAESFVVAAFAAQIARMEAGLQPAGLRVGNLEAHRDFLDVRDVVEAYVQAVVRPYLPIGAIYNIASGVPRRIGDVLQNLCAQAHIPVTIETDRARMRTNEVPLAIGTSLRAATDLGWRPRIVWETTLADTLAFWREKIAREGGRR